MKKRPLAATQLRKEIGIIRIIFPEIKFMSLINKTSIPEEIILIIPISFLTKKLYERSFAHEDAF